MNQQTKNVLIGLATIVVILALGYFAWKERGSSAAPTVTSSTPFVISTTTVATSTKPGYTIVPVAIKSSNAPTPPNYAAPLIFSASVSSDERSSLESQFAQVQSALKGNALDFQSWIGLGNIRKEAGDYTGAAADWQYMSVMYPTNIVSFANLADLYTNYHPNYPKAAAAYKTQIANDPTDVYIYTDLFSLYTDQYPEGSTAPESVLKEGIANNPKATELYLALARYYKSKGDTADARVAYDAAINSAKSQGQTSSAANIQAEENTL